MHLSLLAEPNVVQDCCSVVFQGSVFKNLPLGSVEAVLKLVRGILVPHCNRLDYDQKQAHVVRLVDVCLGLSP